MVYFGHLMRNEKYSILQLTQENLVDEDTRGCIFCVSGTNLFQYNVLGVIVNKVQITILIVTSATDKTL